jgi:hypothetical protein
MESASSPNHEASLLQRWFGPVSLSSPSPSTHHEHFSETDLRDISDVLRRFDRGEWSRIPRIYAVLRRLDRLEAIDLFLAQAISDIYFPFTHQTLPQSLNPSLANEFLRAQQVVLSSALDLERETGRHRHFSSSDDVPFIKLEDLGKGASGYVDRVISTVSHKEYARKLLPRGRTFRRNQSVLRSFQHELNALKKLCHHRHIVQLIGSYTDPQFVGIIMSPVADCDLKDFLISCVSDGASNVQARKSFIRSFFGCLTSALSYYSPQRHQAAKCPRCASYRVPHRLWDFARLVRKWKRNNHGAHSEDGTLLRARGIRPYTSKYLVRHVVARLCLPRDLDSPEGRDRRKPQYLSREKRSIIVLLSPEHRCHLQLDGDVRVKTSFS